MLYRNNFALYII